MKITITEEISLLELLKKQFPDSSNNTLKSWVEKERITVDGRVAKKSNQIVRVGETVEMGQKAHFINYDVRIFHEDAHLVVIYKPEGLLSVDTDTDATISAHEILKRRAPSPKVYPVQRLDRETSGIMVFAYTEAARDGLKKQFEEHSIEREYSAIIEGTLAEKKGVWKSYLKEDSNFFVRSTHSEDEGKLSVTHYEVVQEAKGRSLMRFRLETGRKNQIRVHCKEAGHPIAGDKKYGATTNPAKRLCLHACKLGFIHPITKQSHSFSIPLPDAFFKLFK
ncbi:MAG: RluA family pseudouridine synthase [Chlamydiales bacterium]|nr:RluA family pseudouridine synthase [Chlamydiales bacterium]